MRPIKFFCKNCKSRIPTRTFGRFKKTNKIYCDRKCYAEHRRLIYRGDKAPNYKDGNCNDRQLLRASLEYKFWRKAIFKRDNYTCVMCGNPSKGDIEADHIKSFAMFPELRFKLSNGRTLCSVCHKLTDNYGYRKGVTHA